MTAVRRLFPALHRPSAPKAYLDSAATCLVPEPVIRVVAEALSAGGSASRSVHSIGLDATRGYAQARIDIARHLGVDEDELVLTSSATHGLNLLAAGWVLRPGDEVCVSVAEHHANLLPWMRACEASGARLVRVACDERSDLDLSDLRRSLSSRTRVVALTHVSNVTGGVTALDEVASIVRKHAPRAALVIDGTQAMAHLRPRPRELGCHAYVFSGHKVYGPPGCGVVWSDRWSELSPLLWGGGMAAEVGEVVELHDGPARFEGGTPNHPAAIGLAEALRFCEAHESPPLVVEALSRLREMPGVRVLGSPRHRVGLLSFVVDGVHPHDVGTVLDQHGVAVRVGHHCAQPMLAHLGVESCVRASFGLYNNQHDIDLLVQAIVECQRVFGVG